MFFGIVNPKPSGKDRSASYKNDIIIIAYRRAVLKILKSVDYETNACFNSLFKTCVWLNLRSRAEDANSTNIFNSELDHFITIIETPSRVIWPSSKYGYLMSQRCPNLRVIRSTKCCSNIFRLIELRKIQYFQYYRPVLCFPNMAPKVPLKHFQSIRKLRFRT